MSGRQGGRGERQRLHFRHLLSIRCSYRWGLCFSFHHPIQPETPPPPCCLHHKQARWPHHPPALLPLPGPGGICSWPVPSLLVRTFYCSPKPNFLFLLSRLLVTPSLLPLHLTSTLPIGTPAHPRLHRSSLPLYLSPCFTSLHPMNRT